MTNARTVGLAVLVASLCALGANSARAWDPFRTPNSHVERGNQHMTEGNAEAALEAYDEAARELPSKPGVHLNRGIALLEQGKLDKAKTALLTATQSPADGEIRASAYYNLGLTFFRKAAAKADEETHAEAQKLYREAAGAFARSLRARPGNENAAWNLELARRRIREQRGKAKQNKKKRANNQQDQQGKPNQQDQQDQQGKQEQQGQQNEQASQGKKNRDSSQSPQEKSSSDRQRKRANTDPQQRGRHEKSDRQDSQAGERTKSRRNRRASQRSRSGDANRRPKLSPDDRRLLEALRDRDKTFQHHVAGQRSGQRRQPKKDW